MSKVRVGDVFRLYDLDGKCDQSRLMTVCGISVKGEVSFTIDLAGVSSGLHSIRYDLLLLLIQDGIWVRMEV